MKFNLGVKKNISSLKVFISQKKKWEKKHGQVKQVCVCGEDIVWTPY